MSALAPRRALAVLYGTLALDALGIGLVFPILPRLLEDVTGAADVARYLGITAALYAAVQLVCAPLLGMASDVHGRRPVLVVSLLGSALSYLVMAFAPTLPLLLIGRALAGATSASAAVATAYLTDVSTVEERPRRFGLASAMFGAGFAFGPVLGGLLGEGWVRLPFLIAGALNTGNLLLALVLLPESRVGAGRKRPASSPLAPLRFLQTQSGLVPLVLVFFLLSGAGEAYGTCWALWGGDAFHWGARTIGLSLGTFGVCQTLAQALLPGPATRRLGERGAVLVGLGAGSVALLTMAFARHGSTVFAAMPLFALGGIGAPALQARASRQVASERQGELQGLLSSIVSLASIVAPLGFTTLYARVAPIWPGAVWLAVVAAHALALWLLLATWPRARRDAPPQER